MSFIFNDEIRYSDSPNIDAFGRLRVSNPIKLFASTLTITSGDTYYETITTGSGSETYNVDRSEMQFNVTGNGDSVIREQHGYSYYQPGNSQLVFMTGIFGSPATGVVKSMGYNNSDDGLMFKLSGSTFGVSLKTSTSGSPVETFIPQSEWNIDTLDTGHTLNPSGYHLDITKTNIYVVNFQWLGVGRIIYGLNIDGELVPVHQILNANNNTAVYMKTANLPVRYEVSSTSGSDSSFRQICSTVITEGGEKLTGYPNIVSNGLTTRTFSPRQSVISMRLSPTFQGKTNRVIIEPQTIELLTTTTDVDCYWELILQRGYLGETNLGGAPTWVTSPNTPLDYSVNGTTVVGGTVLDSGFLSITKQSGTAALTNILKIKTIMALDSSGANSDYLHLVVTPNANSSWSGVIKVISIY